MPATTAETRGPSGRRPRRVRSEIISLRATPDFKDWLSRFAAHLRKDTVDAIDEGLLRYARAEGFEPPPRR